MIDTIEKLEKAEKEINGEIKKIFPEMDIVVIGECGLRDGVLVPSSISITYTKVKQEDIETCTKLKREIMAKF